MYAGFSSLGTGTLGRAGGTSDGCRFAGTAGMLSATPPPSACAFAIAQLLISGVRTEFELAAFLHALWMDRVLSRSCLFEGMYVTRLLAGKVELDRRSIQVKAKADKKKKRGRRG